MESNADPGSGSDIQRMQFHKDSHMLLCICGVLWPMLIILHIFCYIVSTNSVIVSYTQSTVPTGAVFLYEVRFKFNPEGADISSRGTDRKMLHNMTINQ